MDSHFSAPKENVLQLGLHDGMKVADLGAGSGHYTQAAASVVGPEGRVYAVEVRQDLLQHIKESAHKHHRSSIEPVWGDIEKPGGTGLRDNSMDAAILANTLFQIEDRRGLVGEVKRILKPGGKLLLVEWAGSYSGMGPHPSQVVGEQEADQLFIAGGLHKIKSFRGGPHHYALVFEKS